MFPKAVQKQMNEKYERVFKAHEEDNCKCLNTEKSKTEFRNFHKVTIFTVSRIIQEYLSLD